MKPPVDGLGKPINDPKVLAAFEAWAASGTVIRDLHKLRRAILALAASADGVFINPKRVDAEFRNIVAELRFAQPFTTCPMGTNCERGCRYCKGAHWVTEAIWKRLPEELKR